MRFQSTFVVLLVTFFATAQEEPLPVVQARLEPVAPLIALAVEPYHQTAAPSLLGAARANDYATFESLYREAREQGRDVRAFTALHELWTFSMTDPIGAFYGASTYEKLARTYPGFARYIDEYKIVDANGNAFYPTSETRAFLVDRAAEGRVAEPVRIASTAAAPSRRTTHTPATRTGTPASSPAGPAASRRRSASNTPAPVKAPVKAAARDAAVPAGEDAGAPKQASVATAIAAPPVEAPVVVQAQPEVQPQPEPATVAVDNNRFGTRGLFLLLIGIVGIGVLALMLRTPREMPASILAPPAEPKAGAPVELKRPAASSTPQTPGGKNRASGSHG